MSLPKMEYYFLSDSFIFLYAGIDAAYHRSGFFVINGIIENYLC